MRKTLSKLTMACVLLMASGCSADLKDAAMAGVTDFITSSISETLMTLLPVSKLLPQSTNDQDSSASEAGVNQEAAGSAA
jgi:hypothetical protein